MSLLDETAVRRRGRRRRRWWEGGSSTAGWNAELLGWALCAVGAGALAVQLAPAIFPVETASAAAHVLVWLAMAVPVVLAFSRSRPRGLLRFRAVDLVYGIVFGTLLRLAAGAVSAAEGDAAWPSSFSTDGALPPGFALDAIADAVVTPFLEELLFRGVVLISLFTVLRRGVGAVAGGVAAVMASTALFVAAHSLAGPREAPELAAIALLGIVAGAFTLGTGRIWPAVAVHVVFNATGVALLAVGTLLA